MDFIILSLDTIAYGGLVASRRINDDFNKIIARLEDFKEVLKSNKGRVLAFPASCAFLTII